MRIVYMIFLAFGLMVLAYGAGIRFGRVQCRAAATKDTAIHQVQFIKQTEKINESVLRTGLGDIRRILREKYTIAE